MSLRDLQNVVHDLVGSAGTVHVVTDYCSVEGVNNWYEEMMKATITIAILLMWGTKQWAELGPGVLGRNNQTNLATEAAPRLEIQANKPILSRRGLASVSQPLKQGP